MLTDGRSLQAKQLELERQQATDSLKKGLEKRPDKEELIERMSLLQEITIYIDSF